MDYSKALIYKLCSIDENIKICYIGSTTNLSSRKWSHKTRCTNVKDRMYNNKLYTFIRDNGGWSKWHFVIIEEYKECKNKNELWKRERKYIEDYKDNLNNYKPWLNDEEKKEKRHIKYYKENREKQIERSRIYRSNNPDKVKNYNNLPHRKQKYNCECGGRYTYTYKSSHMRSKKHQQWLINPNPPTGPKGREKVNCECGGKYCFDGRNRHFKTKRHIKWLEEKNIN